MCKWLLVLKLCFHETLNNMGWSLFNQRFAPELSVVTFNTRPSRTFVEINPWLPYSIVNASVNIFVCGLKLSRNTFLRYVFVFLVYFEKE